MIKVTTWAAALVFLGASLALAPHDGSSVAARRAQAMKETHAR